VTRTDLERSNSVTMKISEIIATTVDNTFIGTLFAGIVITYLGLRIYHKQKGLDIEYLKRNKMQDLATTLLTHINVAVKDYLGQISVHNGSNQVAKVVFNKMESLSPGFASKDTSKRFAGYVSKITQAFNDLSTPLALDVRNESKVRLLAEAIPLLTFILSTTTTLPDLPINTINDLSKQTTEYFDKIRSILESIINE